MKIRLVQETSRYLCEKWYFKETLYLTYLVEYIWDTSFSSEKVLETCPWYSNVHLESNFRNLRVRLRTIRKNWRSNLFDLDFWLDQYNHTNSTIDMNFLVVVQSVDRIPTRVGFSVVRIREESINSPSKRYESTVKVFISRHMTETQEFRCLCSSDRGPGISVLIKWSHCDPYRCLEIRSQFQSFRLYLETNS